MRGQARKAARALPWIGVGTAIVVVLVVAVTATWPTAGAPAGEGSPRVVVGSTALATPGPGPAAGPSPTVAPHAPRPRARWSAFARAGGMALYLPAPRPVAVTYHEAALEGALALHPLGHVIHNYNRYKFHARGRTRGPGYIVMSSRGRSQPATSAADIVLRRGMPVRAPVTGRVVGLRTYRLYCRYPDARVAIAPAARPDLRLVMLHVRGLRVHRGDRVFATLSVIGRPRPLPFRSQVDDYLTGGDPHVHIEVEEPSSTPVPACSARNR